MNLTGPRCARCLPRGPKSDTNVHPGGAGVERRTVHEGVSEKIEHRMGRISIKNVNVCWAWAAEAAAAAADQTVQSAGEEE